MTQKDLEILLYVLEEAERTNDGNHWLPETYSADLRKSISVVNKELKTLKNAFSK